MICGLKGQDCKLDCHRLGKVEEAVVVLIARLEVDFSVRLLHQILKLFHIRELEVFGANWKHLQLACIGPYTQKSVLCTVRSYRNLLFFTVFITVSYRFEW